MKNFGALPAEKMKIKFAFENDDPEESIEMVAFPGDTAKFECNLPESTLAKLRLGEKTDVLVTSTYCWSGRKKATFV